MLLIIKDKVFVIDCPEQISAGVYDIKDGVSLEFAQVNGSPYGWTIGDYPVLKRRASHSVYVEDYDRFIEYLETGSFWQGVLCANT